MRNQPRKMTIAITEIKTKSDKLIYSYKKDNLSDDERINQFLDKILEIRKPLQRTIKTINKLDDLLLLVTWADVKTKQDKKDLKYIFKTAKIIHKKFLVDYAFLHKRLNKKLFKEILFDFKNAVDDFEDSILEAENVMSVVRKDKKMMSLINSIF